MYIIVFGFFDFIKPVSYNSEKKSDLPLRLLHFALLFMNRLNKTALLLLIHRYSPCLKNAFAENSIVLLLNGMDTL